MLRRLLLCCMLSIVPGVAVARINLATAPIGRMNLPWWRARFDSTLREARADPNAQLVWLGDSITYYWQRTGNAPFEQIDPIWRQYYGRYHPLDFGLIGDTTSSVIWRINHGEFNGLHPKLVIVLIGANNLGATHWGAQMTVPGIQAVVNDVHRHVPAAKILLLGVLPSQRSTWISAETVKINHDLARIYQDNALVTFRNVGPVLEHDGRAQPSLYVDPKLSPPGPPLHPDATGMHRIAATLAPTVAMLMK
jgi:lysophospholipase L1-like esterase